MGKGWQRERATAGEKERQRVRETVHLIQMKIQRGITAGGMYIFECVVKRDRV